jgi:hypothetical protein
MLEKLHPLRSVGAAGIVLSGMSLDGLGLRTLRKSDELCGRTSSVRIEGTAYH